MSMADILDGTKAPAHGMFFMESAGGYHPRMETTAEERQPSCFGLEEEKGEREPRTGSGASRPLLIETRPTL